MTRNKGLLLRRAKALGLAVDASWSPQRLNDALAAAGCRRMSGALRLAIFFSSFKMRTRSCTMS